MVRHASPQASRWRAAALVGALLTGLAASAHAHEVGLSRGTYAIEGERVTAEVILSRREVSSLVPDLDADHDGQLLEGEIAAARPALERVIVDRVRVESGGAACPGALNDTRLAEEDGLIIRATYACAAPVAQARIDFPLLDDLAHGHRHIARSAGGTHVVETVISRSQRTFEISAQGGATPGAGPAPAPPSGLLKILSMLWLGVEHILTGYDHLLFLFGLVLVGGRPRSLLWVVTAFTIAHSITLALAALGVYSPRSSIIEPAIALSIAYVGVENFFVKNAEKRWRITFPFGLIHGFGFASALREIALPKAEVPVALFLFNAGVEVGQIGVLVPVLVLLERLRKEPWFEKNGVRVASVGIVIAGLVLFFARVLS
jgi:hydrogenase/urease accessory protein HupE